MSKVIFSPHTDDAIFSLSNLIERDGGFTIASVFAKIPSDDIGKKKHTLLRKEHSKACEAIGAVEINGDILDDVYGPQDIEDVDAFVLSILDSFDEVYLPIGIHHPDHVLLHNRIMNFIDDYDSYFYLYTEHPYKMMFPETYARRVAELKLFSPNVIPLSENRDFYVSKYKSQIGKNREVIPFLLVDEEIWRIR